MWSWWVSWDTAPARSSTSGYATAWSTPSRCCGAAGDAAESLAFRREAALLASLRHPGLARIHEVGEGRCWGVLLAASQARPYTAAEVHIVSALVSQGMTALDNAELFAQVTELATRDGLTGLYNRRHFVGLAGRRLGDTALGPTAAVMVDIDHFKKINDTHGHPVGDDVIREVATRLSDTVRPEDIICRYGGEEFVLTLPHTPTEGARTVAERIREAVQKIEVPSEQGPVRFTVSIGVSTYASGEAFDQIVERADKALYASKQSGRNRVTVAGVDPVPVPA